MSIVVNKSSHRRYISSATATSTSDKQTTRMNATRTIWAALPRSLLIIKEHIINNRPFLRFPFAIVQSATRKTQVARMDTNLIVTSLQIQMRSAPSLTTRNRCSVRMRLSTPALPTQTFLNMSDTMKKLDGFINHTDTRPSTHIP